MLYAAYIREITTCNYMQQEIAEIWWRSKVLGYVCALRSKLEGSYFIA